MKTINTMAASGSTMQLSEEAIHVELTYDHLDADSIMNRVRSPKAGAIVLFAGMQFQDTPSLMDQRNITENED